MLRLSSPITDVPHIGPVKARYFEKLGVTHVRDLLFTFPRRYDDFSKVTPIAELEVGKQMVVRGHVRSVHSSWGYYGRRRILRIYVEIEDDTGVLNVTWFNLRFLERQLWKGRELYVAGKVEVFAPSLRARKGEAISSGSPRPSTMLRARDDVIPPKFQMRSPAMEFVPSTTSASSGQASSGQDKQRVHTAEITPVYSETYGVSSRFIRYQVKSLLPLVQAVPEYLPEEIITRNHLIPIQTALRAAHFPKTSKELERAQVRLRFDELFFLQLAALVRRQKVQQEPAVQLPVTPERLDECVAQLRFQLTGAQQRSLDEIIKDMNNTHPMNRLLQGDVGSGKSAVALVAARVALDAGFKVVYLAPTEILARQQKKVLKRYLKDAPVELLIGAKTSKEKRIIKKRMVSARPLCVVGTHALLQEDVHAYNVGLVIVDEQHRFGVAQRRRLQEICNPLALPREALGRSGDKGGEGGLSCTPHLLSMTATPIPRTLNLTVYGDLDVSLLDEMPPGRKPIITSIIGPQERDEAVIHVLKELHDGRQAYVIAPLVEQSEKLEVKSATETYEEMEQLFPGVAVGLVHGQMKSEEKETVMRNFNAGAIQLLVSTAVVEVGVNVPNAAVMIIEGAERFGLAQLHQIRGRVGRAEYQSYCYLFPTTEEEVTNERLRVLARTNDGFVIAEEDLRLRGPGEVYGVAQSGFGDLKVASLLDYKTIKLARNEAEHILNKDPELEKYPILRKKVEQKNLTAHFE